MKPLEIDANELSKYVRYDENSWSGLVWSTTRRIGNLCPAKEGEPCGYIRSGGNYKRIMVAIYNKNYTASRVIWEIEVGKIPEGMLVDHIDGNSLNNRLSNLRLVTNEGNSQNRARHFSNNSGVAGVRWISWTNADGRVTKLVKAVVKDFYKYFSVIDLGEDAAFEAACKWRKSMMLELNKQGKSDFTKLHISKGETTKKRS